MRMKMGGHDEMSRGVEQSHPVTLRLTHGGHLLLGFPLVIRTRA